MNIENCVSTKTMTAPDAVAAINAMAKLIKKPLAIGAWNGEIKGTISGQTYSGEHISVFREDALVAPFGPLGDAESEACAALFSLTVEHAQAIDDLINSPQENPHTFQDRVNPWMMECFGPEISADHKERNHRFLEESLELVQACGCTESEAHQLVSYVFNRPTGEKKQEVGGVMVTLAALCLAQEINMHDCGDEELARIWTKIDKIREKQRNKPEHSPLPESTPSSRWFENGEADPHGELYNRERARICSGHLTDDEVANAVFLHPNIGNLTAAKERIRWLSRSLEKAMHVPSEMLGKDLEGRSQ